MKRLTTATLIALTLAGSAGAVTNIRARVKTHWSPLCVLFEPYTFDWWWNGCWSDPPPKDPRVD